MERKEINIREKKLCVKLVIYKYYTEMHGQQNIKYTLRFWIFTVLYWFMCLEIWNYIDIFNVVI